VLHGLVEGVTFGASARAGVATMVAAKAAAASKSVFRMLPPFSRRKYRASTSRSSRRFLLSGNDSPAN
jgi:hypothetical protein